MSADSVDILTRRYDRAILGMVDARSVEKKIILIFSLNNNPTINVSSIVLFLFFYCFFGDVAFFEFYRFSLSTENGAGCCGTGGLNPSRETKFSGTYGDRRISIFKIRLHGRRGKGIAESFSREKS